MTLLSSEKHYALACHFHWLTLSSYFELLDFAPNHFSGKYMVWDDVYEKVAEWLLQEESNLRASPPPKGAEYDRLISEATKSQDELISRWISNLNLSAVEAHAHYPSIDTGLWLYAAYCGFLARVALEFTRIVESNSNELGDSIDRVRSASNTFSDFVSQFKTESQQVIMSQHIGDQAHLEVYANLSAKVKQLAEDWRRTVFSTADRQIT
jgi:hypothetical protein